MGLAGRAARAAGAAVLLLMAVTATSVGVRLLPWWFAPGVPLDVAGSVTRAALVLAVEVALLLGIPIGAAWAVARAEEEGEVRALLGLGVHPARLVAASLVGLAPLVGPMALLHALSSPRTNLLHDLAGRTESACRRVTAPAALEIPGLGVSWLCEPGRPPRVAGLLPRGRGWWLAEGARFGPEGDPTLIHVQVLASPTDRAHGWRVAVRELSIQGIDRFRAPSRLVGGVARSLGVGGMALAFAALAAGSVLLLRRSGRALALAMGGAPAALALAALHGRRESALLLAGLALLLGLLPLVVVGASEVARLRARW